VPALVIAADWMRLARPKGSAGEILLILVLALLPALVSRWWLRLVLGAGALAAAVSSALGVSWLDARPFDDRHDFFGPMLSRFGNGFVDFYDYAVPIDPAEHASMHGVLLLAVFGFGLALSLAIAARRALLAAVVVVAGAGWPATLLAGGHAVARGAFILAAVLLVLGGLGAATLGGLRRAVVPAGAIVVAAIAASSSPALAKPEFLDWQRWDLYNRPQPLVGVSYVWDSNYSGITFPKKETTVLKIKAPPTSLYWRATTLDGFDSGGWVEAFEAQGPPSARAAIEPVAAADPRRWIEQEVTVKALRDFHLVGASIPMAYDAGRPLGFLRGNVAVVQPGLERDQRYKVWSYAPEPTQRELRASPARYPETLANDGFLAVPGIDAVPAFGSPNRAERLATALGQSSVATGSGAYLPLEQQARAVVGSARTPYAAVAGLETWFRATGGFRYDQHPRGADPATPPLVAFVTDTKAGYCQHFAGAMALMLRYLGIPARVAAGFTTGTYDSKKGEWTVTDHDAHSWVEVWFDGYGWLPFDPTPGRGSLSAPYSISSPRFDLSAIAQFLGPRVVGAEDVADLKLNGEFGERGVDRRDRVQRADLPGNGATDSTPRRTGGSLVKLLALLALALVAAIVLAKALVRSRRYLTRDPRRIAGACRRELADYLADQRVRLPQGATLADVGAAVHDELAVDSSAFVRAAGAARYGPPAEARHAAARARRELRKLRRDMRRRLSASDRARGVLSLRSLGFSGTGFDASA
jgi:transglutaminase-like putative cysteine protease